MIRPALTSDISSMALAMSSAFSDEELFGQLMHPHRKEYPEDFTTYFVHKIQRHWYDSRRRWLVGVDPDSGRVLGVAAWERQGTVEGGEGEGWLAEVGPGNVLPTHADLQVQVSQTISPNRAADPVYIDVLSEANALCSHHWSGTRASNWYLDILAVHVDGQGKGIGRELVQWGLDQAGREDVPASVISALGKDGFYRKCGFKEVVGMANVGRMGEAGIQGGTIMFTR